MADISICFAYEEILVTYLYKIKKVQGLVLPAISRKECIMNRIISVLILTVLFAGCSKFEFDPNQSVDLKSADRLNYRNVERLSGLSNKEELTFVVTGDSHLDYDNLERMVEEVNSDKDVDFVLHTGDITDHGLLREFEWAVARMEKLKVPFVVTLGNHDLLSNGDEVYRHMFGNENFVFTVDSTRFICYNSNGREYDFKGRVPNLPWLESVMKPDGTFNSIVLISHVPFWDYDFDYALRADYVNLVNNINKEVPVLASFSGHLHVQGVEKRQETPVPHLIPGSMNRRTYLRVTINSKGLSYEKKTF